MSPHLAPFQRTGSLVFVSGQLAFGPDGSIEGDVAAQTRRCLQNLAATLGQAGLGLSDVVKTTVWLREAADFAAFNAAYAEVFGPHRPARSTVVSALVLPQARVEIEAIARLPDAAP